MPPTGVFSACVMIVSASLNASTGNSLASSQAAALALASSFSATLSAMWPMQRFCTHSVKICGCVNSLMDASGCASAVWKETVKTVKAAIRVFNFMNFSHRPLSGLADFYNAG
ncbi:hypothetical protein ESA_03931 [Cronobacter sakazakii ATCC BAA-894]|uniref:Secreted protein n=1 Tax=Cronobacter sakazakii (strain ATCC BAA-894) TaxID=290339 RepID=A7MQ27_CROS8|nr:hypothetical protein ESA_03931 [Cronobacter sakazakii ATCC BAA-894]